MKQVRVKLKAVGTAAVIAFAQKHHAVFTLPGEEIFAVGQDADTDDAVFGLVSERDEVLEDDGSKRSGELGITSAHFAAIARAIRQEAIECKIKAPFSVSVLTKHGVCSFPVKRLRRPEAKECR